MVMLSPYWAHRNTKYFPDPETFDPVSYYFDRYIIIFYTETVPASLRFCSLNFMPQNEVIEWV